MINDFEDNEDIAEDKRNDGDDRKVCLVKLACCIIIYWIGKPLLASYRFYGGKIEFPQSFQCFRVLKTLTKPKNHQSKQTIQRCKTDKALIDQGIKLL